MPFMLYDVAGQPGQERYTFVRVVQLAGSSGPLANFSRNANPTHQVPFGWHATADDVIRLLGGSPATQAIVIDLKPRVTGNVSLYRLLCVWGFSAANWTPLGLCLRVLFSDRPEQNPLTFKNSFVDPGTDHTLVREFLYVQGGVSAGSWNWGMVGRVNGALLWPDAFDFLVAGLKSCEQEK
jgi:hypothetical protein